MLSDIIAAMDEGKSFPNALEESGAFPVYMIDMLKIGEFSGRTDTVLEELGYYYKREQSLRESIRHAVSYPLIMMVMMGIVIFVLVAKVLPVFQSVFADLGSDLTGFSKIVMDMGMAFSDSLGVILAVILVICVAVLMVSKWQKGREWFKMNFFFIRKISYKVAVSRFASGMSLMLASGLDVEQSLEMILPLIEHKGVYEKIQVIKESIAQNKNFSEAVAEQKIFSGTYTRMLAIGERTGSTDEVVANISRRYDDEIEISLSNMIAIIEPSLIAILSTVVGVILLAVMLPLMGIMSVM